MDLLNCVDVDDKLPVGPEEEPWIELLFELFQLAQRIDLEAIGINREKFNALTDLYRALGGGDEN